MIQVHSMLFAPGSAAAQATLTSPPAVEIPARQRPGRGRHSLKFMASVAGNTIGFGALLAGCWFSLQLMQVLLIP